MDFTKIDFLMVLDILILLLIGMGPKVALVPFIEMTADLKVEIRKKVATKMVKTAAIWAIILVILGEIFMKLFHFSEEALYIAGGIVFLLLALHMITSGAKDEEHKKVSEDQAMGMAAYPLAVPYLLNPVGITMLIIFSAASTSLIVDILLVILVFFMSVFNWLLFTHLEKFIKHLDKSRLAVTEAIFGVILSALAIQLILGGLDALGIIEGTMH